MEKVSPLSMLLPLLWVTGNPDQLRTCHCAARPTLKYTVFSYQCTHRHYGYQLQLIVHHTADAADIEVLMWDLLLDWQQLHLDQLEPLIYKQTIKPLLKFKSAHISLCYTCHSTGKLLNCPEA